MPNQLERIKTIRSMIEWSDQKQLSEDEYKRLLAITDCILELPEEISFKLNHTITRQAKLDIWLPKMLIGILVCNEQSLAQAEINRLKIKNALNRKGIKARILIVIDGYTNDRFKKHKNWINKSNLRRIIRRASRNAAG
jgi:hypothetical protein